MILHSYVSVVVFANTVILVAGIDLPHAFPFATSILVVTLVITSMFATDSVSETGVIMNHILRFP
jgi:ABC-type transport system involved in cytochrome bd biosynthesis fused ATPase/permease subunit